MSENGDFDAFMGGRFSEEDEMKIKNNSRPGQEAKPSCRETNRNDTNKQETQTSMQGHLHQPIRHLKSAHFFKEETK